MRSDDRKDAGRTSRWTMIAMLIATLAMGAAGGVWYGRRAGTPRGDVGPAGSASVAPPNAAPTAPVSQPEAIVITLPVEGIKRMNLEFATVVEGSVHTEVRVPGVVEPDGYREVDVTSLVAGVATEVRAELGQSVRRGQPLASLFSQELADAQTTLISMNADLEVDHKRLQRMQELVKLGAASQEELESVEAQHLQHTAHVEEAIQKLTLYGLTPEQIDQVREGRRAGSNISIPAPIDGIVTTRNLNLGQVVSTAQELFTITDLSSVWVEGNLLEDDFAKVRVGSHAVIKTTAYPDRIYQGTVDYIDPRVDPQTRTAKVRVAINNRDLALRLGMYAELQFSSTSGKSVPMVPSDALQMIGSKTVVYIPVEGKENQFEQRTVVVGEQTSAGSPVLDGVRSGEKVVTKGSFLLRAETLRQYPQRP